MARLLFGLGSLPFLTLGFVHLALTVRDVIRPTFLTPRSDRVWRLMTETPMRLTAQTTMWRAWLGFSFSHGLGLVFFGMICLLAASTAFDGGTPAWGLLLLAPVAAWIYVLLAWRYWFRIPLVGTAIGAVCLTASALLAIAF